LPEKSIQNPILTFAPHDLVGLVARLRPFMGQLGTTPAIPIVARPLSAEARIEQISTDQTI
jgi:acetamidase/formamidase